MATIEEMESKMTMFYYKSNGDIYCSSSGIQDMNYFTGHKEDMENIVDFIVVDKNDFIFRNLSQFKVNITTKTIEMKPF